MSDFDSEISNLEEDNNIMNNIINFTEPANNSYTILTNQLVDLISDTLRTIIAKNIQEEEEAKLKPTNEIIINTALQEMEIFNVHKKPSITMKDYLNRIIKYSHPEPSSLILSLIYLDNILFKANIKLKDINVFKLFYTCFVLSMKFNEDKHNSHKFYAKVGGVSFNDLLLMEYTVLNYFNWDLCIKEETYDLYFHNLYSSC